MMQDWLRHLFFVYLCSAKKDRAQTSDIMKKILLLILSLALFSSCGSYTENEYRCEIAYAIGGVEYSDVVTIKAPDGYVPVYAEGNGSIVIDIFPNGNPFIRTVVYNGKQDVRVSDFNYTLVRTYKASRWNGKEIKKKKLSRLH